MPFGNLNIFATSASVALRDLFPSTELKFGESFSLDIGEGKIESNDVEILGTLEGNVFGVVGHGKVTKIQ